MLTFKINNYLTIKLENLHTNIYIEGSELFLHCKMLTVDLPDSTVEILENIDSMDQVIDSMKRWKKDNSLATVPAESQFWAHCSNFQVWAENDYDTRLLDSRLAFPLLKRLGNRHHRGDLSGCQRLGYAKAGLN